MLWKVSSKTLQIKHEELKWAGAEPTFNTAMVKPDACDQSVMLFLNNMIDSSWHAKDFATTVLVDSLSGEGRTLS